MDKNAITGMVLIAAILGIFMWMNSPSEDERNRILKQQDTIKQISELSAPKIAEQQIKVKAADTLVIDSTEAAKKLQDQYGIFADAAKGSTEFVTLENNLVKLVFSTQGGKLYSVNLKDYKTFEGKPLILFNGNANKFGFRFTLNNRYYDTNELFFNISKKDNKTIEFTLPSINGDVLTYTYSINDDSYMVDYSVKAEKLQEIIGKNKSGIELIWHSYMPKQEKGHSFEIQNSGIYFKYYQDEVDNISSTKSEEKELRSPLRWIGFKDQFFSSVLISKEPFNSGNIKTEVFENETDSSIRLNTATLAVPFNHDEMNFNFYFGPNHFYTLNQYGKELELNRLIHLGWGILGWINRFAVIPVFNYLEGFIGNYGLIILILTILIKVVLFPLTYKSYISTAKMKVLKPQIEEINAKIPKEKAMERQQATMSLYKKAGVNPMGGCLPMLLQFPILIAMFRFFPASIELRQEAFLWAEDLSAYDSIFSWTTHIPLLSDFYGNHISLFCLLMAGTNIVYTWMNQEMTQSSQTMPGMKTMMYIMPIMFLFFFNNYAAGLSYYYFISTLITIGQTLLIRRFVDEKALLAKIHANQKKPVKKSKFQQRLEDMAKQQQLQAKRKK
ncbi:MAG: membrane protein insertase YidC [Marinilabiliaceae bacterium]|nr:membrane protein insertase YidC [Marinilabiliaceae bacterium]